MLLNCYSKRRDNVQIVVDALVYGLFSDVRTVGIYSHLKSSREECLLQQ